MLLLIVVTAAIVVTVMWYRQLPENHMQLSTLCFLYWGASIMWFIDAVLEYIEQGAAYFTPAISDMINDTFLGISVVVFGMLIWLVKLLLKDPKQVLRLHRSKHK